MTIATVINQFVSSTASNSTNQQTATGTVAASTNGKLFAVVMVNTADTVDSVTSSIDGAFTLVSTELCTESSTNLRLAVYELKNPSAGNHTFTAQRSSASASARFIMAVIHVSGAAQTAAVVSVGTTPVADAATFTDAITTTVADTLILAICANGGASTGSTTTLTPGSGQTTITFLNPGSTVAGLAVTSQPAATAGAYSSSFTYDVAQRRAATISIAVAPGTVAADTTPDAFTFVDKTNVKRNTVVTGDPVTITGINAPATVALSGDASGKVQINGGTATASPPAVNNGDTITPVVTSASAFSAAKSVTVTVGGVSDTYTVTTGATESYTFTITVTDHLGTTSALSTTIAVGPTGAIIAAPALPSFGRTTGYNSGTTFDIIVSTTGNDTTGDGSLGNPYRTAAKANAVALAAGGNKKIGFRAGRYMEVWGATAPSTTFSAYNGEVVIFSGGLGLSGWVQCTSAETAILGANYGSIYKKNVPFSSIDSRISALNALMLTENDTPLDIVTRRFDESDLFEQSADSTFFRGDRGDDVTVGVDSNGYATTVRHPSVLGAGTWTSTQLANASVMLLVDPNVPAVVEVASADASTGTLTLANPIVTDDLGTHPKYKPDLSPSLGAYALMNILPYMKKGQWGYVIAADGLSFDLYLWPNSTANLASGIEIAAHTSVVTVTGSGITLDNLVVTHTADTLTNTAPIYVNGAANCTVKECLIKNFSHAQKGYGGVYAKSTVNFKMFNCEIVNGQNQYGFFVAGGRSLTNNTRIWGMYIHRCSQTGPRFYGSKNVAFFQSLIENCGNAAHANKINFYEGCDQVLVYRVEWRNCEGYATVQEASQVMFLMCIIPTDSGGPEVSGAPGRGFYDQTHSGSPTDPNSAVPTDPANNYIINCFVPRVAGASTKYAAIVAGQIYWNQTWFVWNCVADGIASASGAESKLVADNNIDTLNPTPLGANSTYVSSTSLYADAANDNFAAPTSASVLRTKAGKNVSSAIAVYQTWFPDISITKSLSGATIDWAFPGVGPYGPNLWPLAA